MFLSYSTLTLPLGFLAYDDSQEWQMMVLTHSDFFCVFDQRRGGLNVFIFRQLFVNYPWLSLSSIKLLFIQSR